MDYSREDLAWAAGLFEGEGCLTRYNSGAPGGPRYQYPKAELTTTDLDVLEKFRKVVGFGNLTGPYGDDRGAGYKPKWRWSAMGFEKTQALIGLLWFRLGVRRQGRAAGPSEKTIGRILKEYA